jgi:hypothetical protein
MSTPGPSLEESLSRLRSPKGTSVPSPPDLHWAALVLIAIVSNVLGGWLNLHGIGSSWIRGVLSAKTTLLVWLLVQASFVQRLSHKKFFFTTVAASLLAVVPPLLIRIGWVDAHGGTSFLPAVAAVVLWMDLFRMRDSLQHHYNSVEAYGLFMPGILLFLWGPIYLQYHFRKIALWKKQQATPLIA